MLEKNTSDLQQELLSKPNLDRILSENAASFQQESATALLNASRPKRSPSVSRP